MCANFLSRLYGVLGFCSVFLVTGNGWAKGPPQFLAEYRTAARSEVPSFKEFSPAMGREFYLKEEVGRNGEKVSCSTCHTSNPKALGKTRAGKAVRPMAIVSNPERFTDPAKVEKWFRRNCNDVLSRECTAIEKGNFLAFLMSVR
jgi:hypothetical protein